VYSCGTDARYCFVASAAMLAELGLVSRKARFNFSDASKVCNTLSMSFSASACVELSARGRLLRPSIFEASLSKCTSPFL